MRDIPPTAHPIVFLKLLLLKWVEDVFSYKV